MKEINDEKAINDYPSPVTYKGTEEILSQMEKCICKICNEKGKGTGFFCLIPYEDKKIEVLIIIDENILDHNDLIEVMLYNNETKIIKLDKKRIYTSKEYDTTIIGINKNNEKIDKFLEFDEILFKETLNNSILRQSIYILHYPKIIDEQEICVSYSILKKIEEDYKIIHLTNSSPWFIWLAYIKII